MKQSEHIKKLAGEMIRQRREALDFSQKALGDRVGLSRASIANIERGVQGFDVTQLFLFARELQTSPAKLLPEVGDPLAHISMDVKNIVEDVIKKVRRHA